MTNHLTRITPQLFYGQTCSSVYQTLAEKIREEILGYAHKHFAVTCQTPASYYSMGALLSDYQAEPTTHLEVTTLANWCRETVASYEKEANLKPLQQAECIALLWQHIEELPLKNFDLGANPLAALTRLVKALDKAEFASSKNEELLAMHEARDHLLERYGYRSEPALLQTTQKAMEAIDPRLLPDILVVPETHALTAQAWNVLSHANTLGIELWLGSTQKSEQQDIAPPACITENIRVTEAKNITPSKAFLFTSMSPATQDNACLDFLKKGTQNDFRQRIGIICATDAQEYTLKVNLQKHGIITLPQQPTLFKDPVTRSLLAWLRILIDPSDAIACVGVLRSPPVNLQYEDLAAVIKLIRRTKNNGLAGIKATQTSSLIHAETRERIELFLRSYEDLVRELDSQPPAEFLDLLIAQLQQPKENEQSSLYQQEQFRLLAKRLTSRNQLVCARTFAELVCTIAQLKQENVFDIPGLNGAISTVTVDQFRPQQTFDTVLFLHDERTQPAVTDELLQTVCACAKTTVAFFTTTQAGKTIKRLLPLELQDCLKQDNFSSEKDQLISLAAWRRSEMLSNLSVHARRLTELRLDTNNDAITGIAEYLDVLRLVALIESNNEIDTTVQAIDSSLQAALNTQQQHLFDQQKTALPSKKPATFVQTTSANTKSIAVSASDLDLYQRCPLRYKFARVLRIPEPITTNQRFGILIHRVLEKYHQSQEKHGNLRDLLELFDRNWYRSGLRDSSHEHQLKEKGQKALTRYWQTEQSSTSKPVWLERSFEVQVANYQLRGRIDRVDQLADGSYELIDYKTGYAPKNDTPNKVDLQLALYAFATEKSWEVSPRKATYLYLLEDTKRSVNIDKESVEQACETLEGIGKKIQANVFEPIPTVTNCRLCAYRTICPAQAA